LITDFKYDAKTNPDYLKLFSVSPDEKIIVSYNSKIDPLFSFAPNKKNKLIAITPNNEIMVSKNSSFAEAKTVAACSNFMFELEKTGKTITSSKELGDEILSMFN
jgi:hypothetical protein